MEVVIVHVFAQIVWCSGAQGSGVDFGEGGTDPACAVWEVSLVCVQLAYPASSRSPVLALQGWRPDVLVFRRIAQRRQSNVQGRMKVCIRNMRELAGRLQEC